MRNRTTDQAADRTQAAVEAYRKRHLDCRGAHSHACKCLVCSRFGCKPDRPCYVCKGVAKT